ncbi:MAG: 3-phosphoshikimate 1-carboxyvinyltransferase [Alphaproteobacteria bacterium]
MQPLTARPARSLAGTAAVPGDKSLSHRALILGALAVGETRVAGLSGGDDVHRTGLALGGFGAEVIELPGPEGGVARIAGRGLGGLIEPDDVVDCGNSGTGARLLIGLAAGHDMTAVFTGDASLRRRPMARITGPLGQVGARFVGRSGERLPLAVIGAAEPMPITYRLPVASAQVKSAVLLAGLSAPGTTTVIEPTPTRDHSEHLLRHFGAEVDVEDTEEGRVIRLVGQPELTARDVEVAADPSQAAFPLVAALLVPGSDVIVPNVNLNPLRAGLFGVLRDMGADIVESNRRVLQGEPVADLTARAGTLRGIEVPPDVAASMIDEYPILAVAAAFAEGRTEMRGLAELRVKESDRLAMMANGLTALGVTVEELPDGLIVTGHGGPAPANAGVLIETAMDHRIAMSFLVYGMAAQGPVTVDDGSHIATSFPTFVSLMNGLGGSVGQAPA